MPQVNKPDVVVTRKQVVYSFDGRGHSKPRDERLVNQHIEEARRCAASETYRRKQAARDEFMSWYRGNNR